MRENMWGHTGHSDDLGLPLGEMESQHQAWDRRAMGLASGFKVAILDPGWKEAGVWGWDGNGSIWEMVSEAVTIATSKGVETEAEGASSPPTESLPSPFHPRSLRVHGEP